MEELETQGQWWLPEHPEHTVPGTLTFSVESGGTLNLLGCLRNEFSDSADGAGNGSTSRTTVTVGSSDRSGLYSRINGRAGGSLYTLEDCFRIRYSANMLDSLSGGGSETIYVNQIIKGAQFEADEPIEGTAVSFDVSGLAEWIAESGIKEGHFFGDAARVPTENEFKESVPEFRLDAYKIPEREVATSDNRTVILGHGIGLSGDITGERSLTQRFYWRINSSDGQKVALHDLIDWASDLQDLVSIATERTAEFGDVKIWHPDVYHEFPDSRKTPEGIDILARWMTNKPSSDKKRRNRPVLFTFRDFGGIDGIGRWLNATARHRDGLGRVMSTQYATEMFVSDRLLHCSAALEDFDRKTSSFNNSSFKTRLGRCAALADAPFQALVGDIDKWLDAVKWDRDDTAHHLGRRLRTSGTETFYLAKSLYYLYVICIMRACKAPELVISKIANSSDWIWLAPRVQECVDSHSRESAN